MNRSHPRAIRIQHAARAAVAALMALTAGSWSLARQGPPAGEPSSPIGCFVPNLGARLLALRPEQPMPYFLLGEEVASECATDEGRRLARSLLVLAHEIDRHAARPVRLAPSVYLALASIAELPGEREWLLALAADSGQAVAAAARADAVTGGEGELLLAEAIGLMRSGDGREVKQRLQKDAAAPALAALTASQPDVRRLLDDAMGHPSCPVCRNARSVRSTVPKQGGGGNDEVYSLCPLCRGNPGAGLSTPEFRASLGAEGGLVGATHRQWSAQAWLDGGAPQRDPDPDQLAAYYGVDPAATIWRPTDAGGEPFKGTWARP